MPAIGDLITYVAPASIAIGGIFAAITWYDQRKRELQQRRFEQYWKLVDVSQETIYLAKQKAALLLLKKFPEYKAETIEFLEDAKRTNSPWVQQNRTQIDNVISDLARTVD